MAVSEIEKLEARYAENPDGRYFAPLADAYRKAGRVDDAIQLVTQGLSKHPDYLSAHIVFGRCQLDKKDDAGASAAFGRVLELDQENIIALKALAEIAERAGRTEDARRWLMRLLVVDGMNAEAEEDLQRLGGPIAEAEAAPAEAAAPVGDISFADVLPAEPSAAEVPTEPVLAIEMPQAAFAEASTLSLDAVPPPAEWGAPPAATPEPALEPAALAETQPTPALEIEPVEFEAPAEAPAPAEADLGDVVPFDDQLSWGAGERTSRAIRREDIIEAEKHHAETTEAIDFVETAHGEAHVGSAHLDVETPAMQIEHDDTTFAVDAPRTEGGLELEEAPMAPEMPSGEAAAAGTDLALIMPEEVTPADEMRRPSMKQVRSVSPEPAPVAAEGVEVLVTETMGDLYLKQGFKTEAADVYRRLLALRPGDPGLTAKLAAIESPPAMSASALGMEAVGAWLRRIARASLGTAAPEPPPPPVEGPTPMESAFATESEPAPAPPPTAVEAGMPGQPAREATNQFSLDQLFGAPTAPAPSPETPSAAAPSLGASFDEFFGAGGPAAAESARPREGKAPRRSEDDLSAFNAWLHGLKR